MDKLFDSSTTYEKLRKSISLELVLYSDFNNQNYNISLTFPAKRFQHCTGVEKLVDLSSEIISGLSNENTKQFYRDVRNQEITEKDLKQSVHYYDAISQRDGIEYTIEDRLDNLTNLYNYFHASNDYSQKPEDTNIYIYTWERDTDSAKRPGNSRIAADLMIYFTDSINKKTSDERSYVWFQDTGRIENNNHVYEITTAFATNLDYSTHKQSSLCPHRYTILSFAEIDRQTGIKVELIKAPQEKYDEIAKREAQIDSNVKEIIDSAGEKFKELTDKRDKFLEAVTKKNKNNKNNKNKKKNIDKKDLKEYKTYIETKETLVKLFKDKTLGWKEEFMKRLCSSLNASHNDKKNLIQDEIASIDPEGVYSKKYLSFSNNMSIDASGTIALAPAVAIPLSEQWNNFKENVQQAWQSFTDNVKLTLQSLGGDAKKLGLNIKNFIGNTIKSVAKQSGKYEIADRSAEIKETVALPQRNTARKTGMNVNTHEEFVENKDERVAENERNRTDRPQDRGNKRDNRDI